jgi:hypothetical protein
MTLLLILRRSLPFDQQIHFKNDDFEIIIYTYLGTLIQLTYAYPNHFFSNFTKKYRFSLENIKTDFRSYFVKKYSSGQTDD